MVLPHYSLIFRAPLMIIVLLLALAYGTILVLITTLTQPTKTKPTSAPSTQSSTSSSSPPSSSFSAHADIPRKSLALYAPLSNAVAGLQVQWHDPTGTVMPATVNPTDIVSTWLQEHPPPRGTVVPAGRPPVAIYISNHQSVTDLSIVGERCPRRCVCVAKRELSYWPLFGPFWTATGNIFIDRDDRASAVASLGEGVARLANGECSIWLFPEGTRNRTAPGSLLPFKKGAFHMAVQAGVPIVPVVISNLFPLVDPLKGVWPGGEVRVRMCEPIWPDEGGVEKLRDAAWTSMHEMLQLDNKHQEHAKSD